ncbi:MAG: nitrile hydratase accessory protein [Pseudomonadota bacterium]
MHPDRPEPVFAEPWHAQVFAVTVHLNETGRLDWSDWAARFGATLRRHGLSGELDGGNDYFLAWLETLEAVLADQGDVAPEDAARMKQAWTKAYLATPHGQPVTLAGDTE